MRPGRWNCLGVVGATPPLWIPASAGMTIGGRNDECGGGGIQALLRLRSIIFVPIAHADCRRHTEV